MISPTSRQSVTRSCRAPRRLRSAPRRGPSRTRPCARAYARARRRRNTSFLVQTARAAPARCNPAMTARSADTRGTRDAARGRLRRPRPRRARASCSSGRGARRQRAGAAHAAASIAALVAALWARDVPTSPSPRRVLQARDTALIVAEQRDQRRAPRRDARWRYAIALLDIQSPKEDTMTHDDATPPTETRAGGSTPRRHQGRRRRHQRTADDRRGDRAAERRGAAARPPPRGRGLLRPRRQRDDLRRRRGRRGRPRRFRLRTRATSRTATPSAPTAAGCCSSARPAASKTS